MIRFKKRAALAFFLGCVMSFFWLFPVFGPPVGNAFDGQLTPLRVIRLLTPFLVWMLVTRRELDAFLYAVIRKFPAGIVPVSALGVLVIALAFVAVPLVSGGAGGGLSFIISGVMPVVTGGLVLMGFALLEERDFRHVILGLGFMTLCFLLLGMVTSHFESTIYFGRVRILMGFDHPLYSASAVVGAMIYVAMVSKPFFLRQPRWKRALLAPAFLLALCVLLFISQSRDILFASLLGIGCALVAQRFSIAARLSVIGFFIFGQIFMYTVVLFVPDDSPIWTVLNTVSSFRLQNYRRLLVGLINVHGIGLTSNVNAVKAMTNPAISQAVSNYVGFSVIDSVFLNFLINYGLVGLVFLVGVFLAAGWRLSRSRQTAIAFGALCALTIVFSLDGVGITTSNLVVFLVFAYIIRVSARPADSRAIV